jgi:hypothetical protein
MRNRRYFLSTMIACLSMAPRLSWGAAFGLTTASSSRVGTLWPPPVIDGLLGEYLVKGTTGRLCIFGKNLQHVETLLFRHAGIGARPIMISENELAVDITVPINMRIGKHRFFIKTKSGETCAGGDVTVILVRESRYSASRGSPRPPTSPRFPCTPGFPGQRSCTIEEYYNDRPALAGIGASLL